MSRVALRAWCLASLITAIGGAQTHDEAAEALFRAGRLAMKHGETELACQRFRESLGLRKTAGTQLNLAICEQELGNFPRAWTLLRAVTQSLPADDRRRALVQGRLESVEMSVARVTLVAAAQAPPDTTAWDSRNEVELPLGSTFAVMPGQLEVDVRASKHEPRAYPLRLVATEALELTVTPGPRITPEGLTAGPPSTGAARKPQRQAETVQEVGAPSETPGPEPRRNATESTWSRRQWAGTIALGVAGVALATTGVAGLVVLREKEVVADECTPGPEGTRECTDEGLQAGDRGQLYSNVGTVSFGVALLGAGLGGYLWLSENHRLTAGVSASEARVTVSGSF